MNDDFNTPQAISILFELVKLINNGNSYLVKILFFLLSSVGLGMQNCDDFLVMSNDSEVDVINQLIERRNQARVDKNYKLADEIRDQLNTMNIILEDGGGETIWHKSR